jgi:microsomal prostaglandin-E synthase 2
MDNNNNSNKGLDITLYQYKICPFCGKVKSFLDYKGINYKVIEVNPITKNEIKQTGHTQVPIAEINGKTVLESEHIINSVKDYLVKNGSISKHDADEMAAEDTAKWMQWCDKRLAVLLYPNITRSFGESWQCFEYASSVPTWSFVEKYSNRFLGPIAMLFANSKIKKKYNIVDERKELEEVLLEWITALNGKDYLHGDKITMPDLLVFGILRSIEGFDTFDFVMSNDALRQWYGRVNAGVNNNKVQN